MTPEDVRKRVVDIEDLSDPEAQHAMEDTLHEDVLHAIAHKRLGIKEQRALAREALKTKTLEFPRWCG